MGVVRDWLVKDEETNGGKGLDRVIFCCFEAKDERAYIRLIPCVILDQPLTPIMQRLNAKRSAESSSLRHRPIYPLYLTKQRLPKNRLPNLPLLSTRKHPPSSLQSRHQQKASRQLQRNLRSPIQIRTLVTIGYVSCGSTQRLP